MEPGEIDPVRYGVLWERVQNMDKKIDRMEVQIEQLFELANKSNGDQAQVQAYIDACLAVKAKYPKP